jgi:hypothetical protein
VAAVAADELHEGGRFVVVAHGRADGTVLWFSSNAGTVIRWLWVGMPRPPKKARVYLYACLAGRKLSRFLKHCDAFGHSDVVPMPTGGAQGVVLRYFDEVDRLMRRDGTTQHWRATLGRYINDVYVKEIEQPTGLLTVPALLMLRRSLGFSDE